MTWAIVFYIMLKVQCDNMHTVFHLNAIHFYYTACKNDSSQGLFWINSRRGTEVTQPCSELHPSFRFGVSVGRQCQSDGNWSAVDSRNCTMFRDSNPVIVVYYTTNQSNAIDSNDVSSQISPMYRKHI